jgi:3-phenylpropionate/trans-cinnamate dioxygenase ferredoxin subunit
VPGATTTARTRQRVAIPKADLPPGTWKVITVRRREIVVVNDDGRLYALFNRCPHQQAPLSAGRMCGTSEPGPVGTFSFDPAHRVLRCPWHHYEFELASGRCLADPTRLRVARYDVEEEEENYVVLV